MFQRVSDILPKDLSDELLRLARLDRDWMEWTPLKPPTYTARCRYPTRLCWMRMSGSDAFSMWGYSLWLLDGPKVFRPTTQQCQALEQIEVRLELGEYAQPYPALLVDLPSGYGPFESVLCFRPDHILIYVLNSKDHLSDITTSIAVDGRPIETSLQTYDDDCAADAPHAARALRVACNACLALANYGCTADYLYPKEVASDARLATEAGERGARARGRLATAPYLVRLAQDVVLHHTERAERRPGEPTGAEMPAHWRRGHWAMQAHGPQHSLRKRILRPPVFVRADRFLGDRADTSTTYHT